MQAAASTTRRAPRSAKARDRAFVGRGGGPEPLRIVHAKGSYVTEASGRRYLDFFMGWCVGNLGWDHPAIRARLRRFEGPDYVSPHFQYAPWGDLAARLARMTPGKLERCFRVTGGTEAVELALQAAFAYTGRTKVASIDGAYHGNSIAARSVGSGADALPKGALLRGVKRVKPPLDEAALARVERALRKEDVAAFIMEPVLCNLGALAPTQAFMTGLQRLCREHGTLLVMDEVASAFGRTGAMFASEHFGIEPDIMCLAKALTGGHAGMGATIMTRAVADEVEEDLAFYSTYGWHPLSVEAALANVTFLDENRASVLRNVEARSAQFRERLGGMSFEGDADVRVKGLAIGVELEDEAYASRVVERCRERGLLVTSSSELLLLFPALTLDARTAKKGLDILEDAVAG